MSSFRVLPRPAQLFAVVIGALVLAALAVACGGGSSTSTTDAAATAGIPAGSTVIDQDNLAFKPGSVTVKAGEKVYFLNSETALHTATINGKNESGNMKKGAVFAWTAPAAGTYKVTCDYHPQMHATITVGAASTQ